MVASPSSPQFASWSSNIVCASALQSSHLPRPQLADPQVPHVPPQHLFFATAAPFLAFYAFFAVVLYPLAPSLQNPPWLACLPEVLPRGLRGLAAMVQFWVYSLFFVAGDLWGPVMISLAFW